MICHDKPLHHGISAIYFPGGIHGFHRHELSEEIQPLPPDVRSVNATSIITLKYCCICIVHEFLPFYRGNDTMNMKTWSWFYSSSASKYLDQWHKAHQIGRMLIQNIGLGITDNKTSSLEMKMETFPKTESSPLKIGLPNRRGENFILGYFRGYFFQGGQRTSKMDQNGMYPPWNPSQKRRKGSSPNYHFSGARNVN